MRKLTILSVVLVVALAIGLQSVAAVTTTCDPGVYVVSVNSAKVRAETNTNSQQLALVRRNVAVSVIEGEEGARVSGSTLWCSVAMVGEQVGYIHSSLLSAPTVETVAEPIPVVSAAVAPSGAVAPNAATNTPVATLVSTPVPPQGVSCPSMSYTCSQLTCEQAYACLRAGNGRLDRDNDGVPCESICSGG